MTANPAKALGIAQLTGTLEPGKMADVVLWNRDPFSVYALADQVFVDGALAFDRSAPPAAPRSDFLLGQPAREGTGERPETFAPSASRRRRPDGGGVARRDA